MCGTLLQIFTSGFIVLTCRCFYLQKSSCICGPEDLINPDEILSNVTSINAEFDFHHNTPLNIQVLSLLFASLCFPLFLEVEVRHEAVVQIC